MTDYEEEETGWGPLSVSEPGSNKPRMLSEQCSTCILRPGDRMHLGGKQLREFIASARQADSYVICHQTLPGMAPEGTAPAICRGFADSYSTNYLRVMERLGGFVEVAPPNGKD